MKMNKEELTYKLNELSLNARISYSIMCLEIYVMKNYSDIDFTILFEDMWKINSVRYIDSNWYYPMLEKSVESVFEFGNYEDSEYEDITKEEYNKYLNLYTKIRDNKNLCNAIDTIIKMPEYYLNTSVKDNGILITNDVLKIIDFLKISNDNLPDISLLSEAKLSIADYTDNLNSSKLMKYKF